MSSAVRGFGREISATVRLLDDPAPVDDDDVVVDLTVEIIFWIQGESVNIFRSDGRHKMRKPPVISAMHQRPMSAALYITSSLFANIEALWIRMPAHTVALIDGSVHNKHIDAGNSQKTNSENGCNTKLLRGRHMQAPDDLLRKYQDDEIRNKIYRSRCDVDLRHVYALSGKGEFPELFARFATKDFDKCTDDIENNIDGKNGVARPPEGVLEAARYERLRPFEKDAGFQRHDYISVNRGPDIHVLEARSTTLINLHACPGLLT
jgi:hypothetical protein